MKTNGNTLFITGGTSGIGLGLALRFQEAGNTVIIGGRRTELLEKIRAEHPAIDTVVLDVASPESIQAAFETVTSRHPDLNALVNVAGIMLPEDLKDPAHVSTSEDIVTTNLLGTIRVTALFTPFLLAQPDASILTVSSGLAFVPLPLTPTYNATKAAVHSFTQSLRVQLADTSVQVIELVPPAVQTALMGQDESGRGMPLDDYLSETMELLGSQPEAEEILVEQVKMLRFAEVNGKHAEIVAMLNGSH
ncbi:SDR family oxidoreductase [Frondihabitans cladoniiphilus]|uniref:SDR family oxidoreductase n=1 Tax=Frondihabitans cladoniiphilus TaxID=715785 RepID=A0ABP8W453_9MICO